jgi:hypothetical protein
MKRSLFVAAVAALGLLAAPSPARAADQVFNFLATPDGGGSAGAWAVQARRLDTDVSGKTWRVFVKGGPTDWNGNPITPPNVTPNSVDQFGKQVKITWFCCPGETMTVLTASAFVFDNPDPGVPASGPSDLGAWTSAGVGTNGSDHQHITNNALMFDGRNVLQIDTTLSAFASDMSIRVNDGADPVLGEHSWNGVQNLGVQCVPEPASMMLAGAGLAPLVGLLKRRRRPSDEEEAEEIA